MLPLLLASSLLLATSEEPPHGDHEAAVQPAPKKRVRRSPAVPEESSNKPEEKAQEPKKPQAELAKPKAPRPRPQPKPAMARPVPKAPLDIRYAQVRMDNAKLQEALARAQNLSDAPVTCPEEAMAELLAGNARFVAGRRVRTLMATQDPALRETLSKGQSPFAVVVTCSDSRLMDNIIFDQGLGQLFTIREAGNSPDIQGIASVEYAVEHLGSKLVVVLGHSACGAIKAVSESHGKPLPGNLWSFQAAMAGLAEAEPEDPNETHTQHLDRLSATNAQRQAQVILDRSEIVRHLVSSGKVRVVPAMYDLSKGTVTFLDLPKPSAAGSGHH